MESALDAQTLISISLRKIQSSRTQRGGIKLHKNLLVTFVLRNARQFDVSRNVSQPLEDVTAARDPRHCAGPSATFTDLSGDLYNFPGLESDTWHQPAAEAAQRDASACAAASPTDAELMVPGDFWSCADSSLSNTQTSQKTVLDLDTHVVTTVTNGYFHPDCWAQPRPPQGAHCHGKKRRTDTSEFVGEPDSGSAPGFGPAPCKRMRTEEDCEHLDSTDLSHLVSVLGSSGLSEFVTWQHSDLEQILAVQTVCLKHTRLSGGGRGRGWCRAIEAF